MAKRTKTVNKINLERYTLEVNLRKVNYDKFDFREIEEFVRPLTGGRQYQYDAIRTIMTYLWGGSYKDITALAKENFKENGYLRDKYGDEKIFLSHLPLADRRSGVVHMATGTGKSYVIFAVAYLSIVMGYVKRVLVLGPSSTIIEKGLTDKFNQYKQDYNLLDTLPSQYKNIPVGMLTDKDEMEDGNIVIENINAIYGKGGINETFFNTDGEVLVLGDEIHHAYMHLKYGDDNQLSLEEKGKKEIEDERLWMKFLRENKKIKAHIGFTGTPYNADDYFTDVIFNYSIRPAITEKYIKDIKSLLQIKDEKEETKHISKEQRFKIIYESHKKNKQKYSYGGKVKPITICICPTQDNAKKRAGEFIEFLADQEFSNIQNQSERLQAANNKIIVVTSNTDIAEYKDKLENIEETDPKKIGGNVEYIFAVNKLSEGWDVDNVFQIVPMEERIFNSKLLISQVLGRGLRIPRKVSHRDIINNYPVVTITNHEKFASHISELLDAVVESDLTISSIPVSLENERSKHHFDLFNLSYQPVATEVEKDEKDRQINLPGVLNLEDFDETEDLQIIWTKGSDKVQVQRTLFSVDEIARNIHGRFVRRGAEQINFNFGHVSGERIPTLDEIKETIVKALQKIKKSGEVISEANKKQIELYFNSFLPKGTKERKFGKISGNLKAIPTTTMPKSTVKIAGFDRDDCAFIGVDYDKCLDNESKDVVKFLLNERSNEQNEEKNSQGQGSLFRSDETGYLSNLKNIVDPLVQGDERPPFIVNESLFHSPQSSVLTSHTPEKKFVFELIKHEKYIHSWIKSPDKGFYSIDFEYWKEGKYRKKASFNPDFFLLIDIDQYINLLKDTQKTDYIEKLKNLKDSGSGKKYIICVVELKGDNDIDPLSKNKAETAQEHFKELNAKLAKTNESDIEDVNRRYFPSYYIFDLLHESDINQWFLKLEKGNIHLEISK